MLSPLGHNEVGILLHETTGTIAVKDLQILGKQHLKADS